MPPTLLAMGAHYDDCVFGIPGILLRAVRKHYRVVILAMIGDYSGWAPVKGRAEELIEGTIAICKEHGAELRYLGFKSHGFDVTPETRRAVAEVVADVRPDVAFVLWGDDRHDDHVVASRLSTIALRHAGQIVGDRPAKRPRRIYAYDNGPRHTIGFEPDTFVDVSDEWPAAIDWLGRFMALVRGEPYEPGTRDAAQQSKEALAIYRGKTCGVSFAEAVRSLDPYPREIL
jgi:N-acetylglucosamine malate deacetylase 1